MGYQQYHGSLIILITAAIYLDINQRIKKLIQTSKKDW